MAATWTIEWGNEPAPKPGAILQRQGHAGAWRLWDGRPDPENQYARAEHVRDGTLFATPLEPDADAIIDSDLTPTNPTEATSELRQPDRSAKPAE